MPSPSNEKKNSKEYSRKHLLRLRNDIPPLKKQQSSEAIAIRVIKKLLATKTSVIASYLSVGSEVNLNRVHHWAWGSNKTILVPQIINCSTMKFVKLIY